MSNGMQAYADWEAEQEAEQDAAAEMEEMGRRFRMKRTGRLKSKMAKPKMKGISKIKSKQIKLPGI